MTFCSQEPELPTAMNTAFHADLLEGGSEEDASGSEDIEEQDATEDEGIPDVDMAGEDDLRHALDLDFLHSGWHGRIRRVACVLAVLCQL